MSWFSILPASLSFLETWAIRIFLFLGALTIGPWILFLLYDITLFLFRITLYDLPIIGGRARNRPRPRAPSLRNRPGGRPRSLSFNLPGVVSISAPSTPLLGSRSMGTGYEDSKESQNGNNGSAVPRSRKADSTSKEYFGGDHGEIRGVSSR